MLHPDPARNSEIVERWVKYLKPYNEKPDMMLATDSVAFQHQLAHHTLTLARLNRNSIELDFTETDKLPGAVGKSELTLKIITEKPQQFISDNVDIKSQILQKGSELMYILSLKRISKELKARIRLD
jgi:hypothetical protein